MKNEKQIMENTMAYALKQGAEACEIYWQRGSSSSLQLRDGALSDSSAAERCGYSVRLIKDGIPGFAYGNLLQPELLKRSVTDALISCAFLEPEPDYFFTAPGKTYPVASAVKRQEISIGEKREYLKALDAAAKTDSRVKRVERATLSRNYSSLCLMNSLGLDLYRENEYVAAGAVVVAAANGDEELGGDYQLANGYEALDLKEIGENAAADGLAKLGAEPVETGDMPVIFRPEAVIDLLGLLLPSFLGNRVEKGMSRLKDKVGKRIASTLISVYDDALMKESVVKTVFDDEGQPCGKHGLLKNGVIEGFLYNNKYAAKARTCSTGNGFCGSHRSLPEIGYSNFYLAKGDTAPEKLRAAVAYGLEIKDLMGLHMADDVSGDFSLGGVGRIIEKGERGGGVRGIMIAGNIFDLFNDVIAVGSDFKVCGDTAAPSFLVKSLKISGK